MFAYCNNNPVMLFDITGYAPEWWQWVISGTLVVAGITLVVTGFGGVAGGALISAGANSIINSYLSEASGGSSGAGWTGGLVAGAICGAGSGLAGNLLISATEMTGAACLGTLALSGMTAAGTGAVGATAGTVITSKMNGDQPNAKELKEAAIYGSATNVIAGFSSAYGSAVTGMPRISGTSRIVAGMIAAGWALASEMANGAISRADTWFR